MMMYYSTKCCLVLSILTLLSFTASARPTHHRKPPVCVIGAGPAGLTAASELEKKGVDAVVFEKQAEVGGKCQAYYDKQGIFHPLGAAFFSNATYPETLKVLEESGVSIEEFALAGTRQMFRFNFTDGDTEPVPAIDQEFLARIAGEVARYATLWQQEFAPISSTGYKDGVPDELTVSGEEWFQMNNFTALPILLVNPLALYGYGDIRKVPALYVLQYFTPDILTGFLGQHSVYYTDFHMIFKQWAKKALCKTPINLQHEIRCIDRSGKNPVLKYTKPHGNFYKWGKQECSSVVFAFPPSIENLERVGLDMDRQEYDVFSAVNTHNYFSSAVEFALPFGVSYIANSSSLSAPPPNVGEPVAILRLSERSNISTSWSWGPDDDFQSKKSAQQLLETTLSKINKDPRDAKADVEPFDDSDIRSFRKWDYFPHFDSQPLRDNAYGKLRKLQGCNKSYWASGLQGMEIVEWAIRAGQDIVDSYF